MKLERRLLGRGTASVENEGIDIIVLSQNQVLGDRTDRLTLLGAGVHIAPAVFQAIVCVFFVWSKMTWSLGEISSGQTE